MKNPIMQLFINRASHFFSEDDYIKDGLRYCSKCHTPKEAYFEEDMGDIGFDRHPTPCK